MGLRILHCIPSLRIGGAEKQVSLIASAQRTLSDEVHVAFAYDGPYARALSETGVELHHLHARGSRDPRIATELWRLIGHLRPELVHTWLAMMDIAGGLAAVGRRVPWVLGERSAAAAYRDRWQHRALRHWIGQFADAVVANSEGGRAVWAGRRPYRGGVHVVRNAILVDDCDASNPADVSSFGLDPNRPLLAFIGRLTKPKNIPLLLDVVADVCEATRAQFVICGDGPMRVDAELRVTEANLGDRVKILGHRADVWPILKAARLFLSTSSFEGQPNAVLEALTCGCPVVVSDIPAHREFLDSRTAVIVRPTREAFVAAVLQELARGPFPAARAAHARRLVIANTPERAAEEYAAIYREVLRARKRVPVVGVAEHGRKSARAPGPAQPKG